MKTERMFQDIKRGDVVRVKYDYTKYSYGIALDDGGFKVIVHDDDFPKNCFDDDVIFMDVFFNIPDKTDAEYTEILNRFIQRFDSK